MHDFDLPLDDGDQPPQLPSEQPSHTWRVPRGALLWIATWCGLMAVVPLVSSAVGALAGFGVLMLAVALVAWRLDRWCSRQYWHGLREHKP